MRKDERHQIKRDDLLTALEAAHGLYQRHSRRLLLGAGIAVLVIAGGFGLFRWRQARQGEAAAHLGELIRTFRAPVVTSLEALQSAAPGTVSFATPEERDRKALDLAEGLLRDFGDTALAPKALYYKGAALLSLRRFDEAAAAFDAFLGEHARDFLAPLARFDLARAREAQGRPAEALPHFQALAEDTAAAFPREEGWLGVARCHEALGDRDAALKAYRRVVSDFPDSEYAQDARRKVEELS